MKYPFSEIRVNSYKVIRDWTSFNLAPITILTGTNGSGKSSIINLFKILSNSVGKHFNKNLGRSFRGKKDVNYDSFSSAVSFNLNSNFGISNIEIGSELGGFMQLVNRDSSSNDFSYSIPQLIDGYNGKILFTITLQESKSDLRFGELKRISAFSDIDQYEFFSIENLGGNEYRTKVDYIYLADNFFKEAKLFKDWEIMFRQLHDLRYSRSVYKDQNLELNDEGKRIEQEYLKEMLKLDSKGFPQMQGITGMRYSNEYRPFWHEVYFDPQLTLYKYDFDQKPLPVYDEPEFDDLRELSLLDAMRLYSGDKYDRIDNNLRQEEWQNFKNKYKKEIKKSGSLEAFFYSQERLLLKNFSFRFKNDSRLEIDVFSHCMTLISNPLKFVGYSNNDFFNFFKDSMSEEIENPKDILFKFDFVKEAEPILEFLTLPSLSKPVLDKNYPGYQIIRKYFHENINRCLNRICGLFSNIQFLSPIKTQVQRSYLFEDSGNNIGNLLYEIKKKGLDKKISWLFVNQMLQLFEIGDELLIISDSEYFNNKIYVRTNKRDVSLADSGYGVSQLVTLILRIFLQAENNYDPAYFDEGWEPYKPSVICIEEPEANLHPALQSKLADLFFYATNYFNIQFIIESHSEYLIRKVQYLVASSAVVKSRHIGERNFTANSEMFIVYYFNKPGVQSDSNSQIVKIEIRSDGGLTDVFGVGFLDESTHWKFELLEIKNGQVN